MALGVSSSGVPSYGHLNGRVGFVSVKICLLEKRKLNPSQLHVQKSRILSKILSTFSILRNIKKREFTAVRKINHNLMSDDLGRSSRQSI